MSLCFKKQSVEQEISSLFGKTAQELRRIYMKYFPLEGAPPPYYKKYLIDKIAYRMQEIEYGKLSKEEERKLNSIADRLEQGKKISSGELLPGTKLIKEYNGKYHDVLVTDMGFIYEGQLFTSLSAIAGKITGMSYNGPKLFGLRDKKSKVGENG